MKKFTIILVTLLFIGCQEQSRKIETIAFDRDYHEYKLRLLNHIENTHNGDIDVKALRDWMDKNGYTHNMLEINYADIKTIKGGSLYIDQIKQHQLIIDKLHKKYNWRSFTKKEMDEIGDYYIENVNPNYMKRISDMGTSRLEKIITKSNEK